LAGFLAYALWQRPAEVSAPAAEADKASPKSASPQKFKPALHLSKRSGPEKFDWQSLASPDLRQYIANLRAVECPEETIRDIILAEVNRQHGHEAASRCAKTASLGRRSHLARNSTESKFRQLPKKRDLLKNLVGVDVPMRRPRPWLGECRKVRIGARDLPEDKREQVRAIQEIWGQPMT
jgi:hypothetical protein